MQRAADGQLQPFDHAIEWTFERRLLAGNGLSLNVNCHLEGSCAQHQTALHVRHCPDDFEYWIVGAVPVYQASGCP